MAGIDETRRRWSTARFHLTILVLLTCARCSYVTSPTPHLVSVARARGIRRVSIETGTTAPFAPARALYAQAGFAPCEPFGIYTNSPNSACMTLDLDKCPPT